MTDEPSTPFPPSTPPYSRPDAPEPTPFDPPAIEPAPFRPPMPEPASLRWGPYGSGQPVAPPVPPGPGGPSQQWPPQPPRGPGVRVPFAAPPAERDRKRLWISLGVGGAALLLCCVGGVVGFGALIVTSGQATVTEARNTVRDFLDGLEKHDFREAYDQLCTARRTEQSLDEFTAYERTLPEVERFTVHEPVTDGARFRVQAVVQTPETTGTEDYLVISDRRAGALRLCGGPR
ncbi:hypothetical protein [Rugosimonospora africana]|uniref:DUF4878 domain-containing protein n=1 Tax=Rugosimonospora africana TaxID=556532 RepID=A0A8J3R2Z7_9ACTN|nr:hypothetical protein [Rugosimonospora africana]GIH20597.1 hypothetical protein Raf01_87690 [Rugosimonospora africana]